MKKTKNESNYNVLRITYGAVIAAVYVVLTVIFAPISFGPMQVRIAEMLSALSEADAKLLSLRFGLEGGLPLTPEEAGRKLGLTPDEVVAREAAALAVLRQG